MPQEEFVRIRHLTGKQFTYDAYCDDHGVNSHCAAYSSPANSFLSCDIADHHVWINAPFAKIEQFIKHYLKCKSAAPHTTSACIVVPNWQGKWRRLLGKMQLLRTHDKGAILFSAPVGNSSRKQLGPTPWCIEVWYDAPAAPMSVTSVPYDKQPLLMTFSGHVAGHFARTLVDGGATDNLVDAAFVSAKGLKVHKCEGHVLAAGKDSVAIQGYVTEGVRIQSLSEEIKVYVIDLPGQGLQAVLGQGWLLDHKAVILTKL